MSSPQLQMSFDPPAISRDEFVSFLSKEVEGLSVRMNRNRVSMVSVSFEPNGTTRISVHEQFLRAPVEVRTALRNYLATRHRSAWRIVSVYAQTIRSEPAPKAATPGPRGRVHDLGKIAARVNRDFFSGRIVCHVRWGKATPRPRRRQRRSIRYGSWNASTRTVRVNPLLDDGRVPEDFIGYIVFHEMLHSVVPGQVAGDRRMTHTAQFRSLENSYPDVDRMKQMCRELLEIL